MMLRKKFSMSGGVYCVCVQQISIVPVWSDQRTSDTSSCGVNAEPYFVDSINTPAGCDTFDFFHVMSVMVVTAGFSSQSTILVFRNAPLSTAIHREPASSQKNLNRIDSAYLLSSNTG